MPLRNPLACVGRRQDALAQAAEEYRAQIERVQAAGITPSHIDFEQHHGRWAPLYRVACDAAAACGIPAVRTLREPVGWALRFLPWPGMRAIVRSVLLRLYVALRRPPISLRQPDQFLGQSHIGQINESVLRAMIRHAPPGVSEVMLHPGDYDADELAMRGAEIGSSWIHARRPGERDALCAPSVREALEQAGGQAVTYRTVAS